MPLISIPTKARDWLVEHASKEKAIPDNNCCFSLRDLHQHEETGFFAALRCLLPSEVVGMLVMDADCAREGEPLYTTGLPHLEIIREE